MKVRNLVHLVVTAIAILFLAECQTVKVTKGDSDRGTLSQTRNLGFDEGEAGDGDPVAWDRRGGDPDSYLFSVDPKTKRAGKSSALIQLKRDAGDPEELDTSLIQCIQPESFIGKPFRLSGWIQTDGAEGEGAALWIGAYGSDNSTTTGGWFPAENEWRKGSVDWSLYEADTNPLLQETAKICFGPILYGSGSAWFDDLEVVTE
jgi:hypothetical protein